MKWINQIEAEQFALSHPYSMMDMEMGTGKTRVAIDVAFERKDVHTILVVCPKAVIPVWRINLEKFYPNGEWVCWDDVKGTIKTKTLSIQDFLSKHEKSEKKFIIVNYDIVWRDLLGDFLYKKCEFDMAILDESHRAKAAGSKVSKYLSMFGKKIKYRMCLSGTPMANSPLDVYGQYRFLDPTIFGTNHNNFLGEYAIMGGPENKFIVGFKNQQELNRKFQSIAYTCKMSDVADRLKLPPILPPITQYVDLPSKDMKTLKTLTKEFISECGTGNVVINNALTKILRMQQIASGYCQIVDNPLEQPREEELNTAKKDRLSDILSDISPLASVVIFCVFRHDIGVITQCVKENKRNIFEISGSKNELKEWQNAESGVLVVQIQSGAEGIDLTKANHAIYFSLPHSLALYNQSKARLYRPGQQRPVSFIHLIARNTIDESMFDSLARKEDIIKAIKLGDFNFGYMK